MRAPSIFVLIAATAAISTFACGGASSSLLDDDVDAGSGDASTNDGATKHDGSSGCVNPTFGESCTVGETVCGQTGNGNPCCDAAWQCVNGAWQSYAAECLCRESTCGGTTCGPDQYCMVQPPGIAYPDGGDPATSYLCVDARSTCAGGAPTCDCIEAADTCAVDSCNTTEGLVTVDCIGE